MCADIALKDISSTQGYPPGFNKFLLYYKSHKNN
jgi:hypothetical protein